MTTPAKSCYLHPENKDLPSIYLPNNSAIILGRNIDTQIKDLKCSREQVRLHANYDERFVTVQQISKKSCGLNGAKTIINEKYLAKDNDDLELIYGNYLYKIEFNPPCKIIDQNFETLPSMKKRSHVDLDSDDESCSKKIKNESNEKIESIAAGSEKKNFVINLKCDKNKWETIDNQSLLIFTSIGVENKNKIASFDMDGTLITTQSGNVFPKDYKDWKILFLGISNKLKKLHNEGFKIVIFTNQGALGSGKTNLNDFKKKIESVVNKLQVPIQVFIATGRDRYRKPMIGMWEILMNKFNSDVIIDKNESFYVGDAAGRPKDWQLKAKKDHSMVDRLFAMNIELKFHTPEEYFLGYKPAKFNQPSFDPRNLKIDIDIFNPSDTKIDGGIKEIILLVGGPGSGKSTVVKNYLINYVHINRDTLGSWQKCILAMKKNLDEGKSVVIDNTNPDVASRKRFLDVAKEKNIPARCFIMNTSLENAKHNNRFRELVDPGGHMVVSDIIINSYVKTYVEPSITEGFTEIVRVNFVPKFHSDDHRKLYQMYLLEK